MSFWCYAYLMLTINPVVNNKKYLSLNFAGFLPKKVFKDIRDIPRMKCGCCGNEMLNSTDTADFISSFAAGSKRTLENSAMDRFRGTEAFAFLQGLSQISPKQTIAKLLSMKENKFKLQTLSPHTQLDVNLMTVISDGVTVKAPRMLQKLEKYRVFFSAEDAEILRLMDMYAIKYPKQTFAEIFNFPEVAQYHKEIAELNKKQMTLKRVEVFKRLREFGQNFVPEDLRALQSTNSKAISILNSEYFDADIKKGLIDDLYNGFVDGAKGKISRKKFMKIVDDFPIIGHSPDSFVCECVDKKSTDKDIVTYFVKKLQATYEHWIARSKGGEDSKENIIILCGKCNHRRANLPYPFFLRFEPEMITNLPKQFNKIMTYIIHGKLIGYDDYPILMKQRILNNSDDLIRLQIGDFLSYRKERAMKRVEKAQAALANDDLRFNSASERLSEIDTQIKELEGQIRKLKKERQPLKVEVEDARNSQQLSKEKIINAQSELEYIQENITEDKDLNASLKYKRRKLKK